MILFIVCFLLISKDFRLIKVWKINFIDIKFDKYNQSEDGRLFHFHSLIGNQRPKPSFI